MTPALVPGLSVEVLGQADANGQTESIWGSARVLVKGGADHPNLVVNEYLANRLAVSLGVPVPMGDIWLGHPDREPRWVVAAVQVGGVDVPPATPVALARVDEGLRARMLCFDALILNTDRHEENVLLLGSRAWLVDHEQAFFGSIKKSERARGIESTRDRRYRDVAGLWSSAVRPGSNAVASAAQGLRGRSVTAIDDAARQLQDHRLLNGQERKAIVDFVSYRRDKIAQLLDRSTVERGLRATTTGTLFSDGGDEA